MDLIVTREELNEQESAVKVKWIRISPTLLADPIALNKTMTELESSEKKIHHLLSYLNHCKKVNGLK